MSIHCSPLTNDTLFDGRLICRQYRAGYRFSIDAVLAAHFSTVQEGDRILDLGCGCGVIGLILASRHRDKDILVTGIEIQPDLAMLAHDNVLANDMEDVVSIVEGDLRQIGNLCQPESFELVVCNPPYRQTTSGRISSGDQRSRARHEIDASLVDILGAASFAVRNRGQVIFVYPADRSAYLLYQMKTINLEPKRIRMVFSYPGSGDAALILVEGTKNGGEGCRILEPLYIYTARNGSYTEQIQQFYS